MAIDANQAALLGATIGAVATTAGAIVVLAIQESLRRRNSWQLALESVCEEMAENSNRLSYLLMAMGIMRDANKPGKTPRSLYLPFPLSIRAFEELARTQGSHRKARELRRKIRSSYGLISQVQYLLDECRTLSQEKGQMGEAVQRFLDAEALLVRAKARHRDDLKKVVQEFSVETDVAFPSAVGASIFFEPSEKTVKQLAMAERLTSEMVKALARTGKSGSKASDAKQ